jgi:hypothetical protein
MINKISYVDHLWNKCTMVCSLQLWFDYANYHIKSIMWTINNESLEEMW